MLICLNLLVFNYIMVRNCMLHASFLHPSTYLSLLASFLKSETWIGFLWMLYCWYIPVAVSEFLEVWDVDRLPLNVVLLVHTCRCWRVSWSLRRGSASSECCTAGTYLSLLASFLKSETWIGFLWMLYCWYIPVAVGEFLEVWDVDRLPLNVVLLVQALAAGDHLLDRCRDDEVYVIVVLAASRDPLLRGNHLRGETRTIKNGSWYQLKVT